MAEELTNPLTSLLKKKYGIAAPSNVLRFTEKDTLFTAWRKTAQFIYKNGEWSDQDYLDAIMSTYEPGTYKKAYAVGKEGNKDFFGVGESENIERIKKVVAHDTKDKATPADLKLYKVKFENSRDQYFVIDPTNHLTSKHNASYHFTNDPGLGSWKLGNANLTIGYAKLKADVLAEFDKNKDYSPEEKAKIRPVIEKKLQLLENPEFRKYNRFYFEMEEYGNWTHDEFIAKTQPDPHHASDKDSDKYRIYVQNTKLGTVTHTIREADYQEARKSNLALKFLHDYLADTYNLVIEQHFERDLDKQTHARAWEQKKQINKETRAMMDKTQLKQYFKAVELDNDVDLDLYKQLSPEMMRLLKIMPAGDQKPILRLRKLGNYKAKGMYVPSKNTLVVDFRRPGEIYQNMADGTGTAGYTSFVHEYGHYLDRHLTADDKPLSIQPEFRKILQAYQRNFDAKTKGTPLEKHAGYFKTPTEVFARAFEVYTKQAGLKSNLIADSYHSLEYRCIDLPIYQDLKAYFDKLPGFENLAKNLNQDLSVAKEQTQPKEPTKTSERQSESDTAESKADTQEKPAEKPAAQRESGQGKAEETIKPQEKFLPSDARQNSAELADYQELKKFAVDILNKWTQTPERLEKLIDATGSRLLENNPNRVIEFDQWQTKRLPRLVSKQNLQMMEVDPAKYKAASIRGFEALPLHKWQSSELYDLDALLNQADHNGPDYKQLQKLEKMTSEKEYNRMAANVLSQKLEQSGIPDPDDQTLKPVVRMVAHITRHELNDALTEGKQEPFKFTPAERELLKKTPAEKLKGLYLSSTKSTQTFYNQIAKPKQQELAPTRSFAKPKRKER